jgi:hypothetical protein
MLAAVRREMAEALLRWQRWHLTLEARLDRFHAATAAPTSTRSVPTIAVAAVAAASSVPTSP